MFNRIRSSQVKVSDTFVSSDTLKMGIPCLRLHISSSLLVGWQTHFPEISLQVSPSKQGGSHKESEKTVGGCTK